MLLIVANDEETRAHRYDALIEDGLAAAIDLLREAPESAKAKDLLRKAETYRRTLERWSAVPPTHAQRTALRDLVFELRTSATELSQMKVTTPAAWSANVGPGGRKDR
jgi:hypothetical protein